MAVGRRKPTAAELARQLAALLQQSDLPANDDTLTEDDERELNERADRAAERMRRARSR